MNPSKMTRVAKMLDLIANIGGKITAAAGVVCTLVALFTFIFGDKMFSGGTITLELDFIRFHLNENFCAEESFIRLYAGTGALGGSLICFLIFYISKLLRRILSPMKIGRPFEAGISGNLKKVGWAVLIGGFLCELLGVVLRILLINAYSIHDLFTSEVIVKTESVFAVNLDFVLIACVIFFLSYIFTYGQSLQKESDETL